MAVREMQKTMARLRLLLAEGAGKESQLDTLYRQFQQQMKRAPTYLPPGS